MSESERFLPSFPRIVNVGFDDLLPIHAQQVKVFIFRDRPDAMRSAFTLHTVLLLPALSTDVPRHAVR